MPKKRNTLSQRIAGGLKSGVKRAEKNTSGNASDAPDSSEVNELLQSGVNAHKARSGANNEVPEDNNSLFQELGLEQGQEEPVEKQEKKMKTADDISEEMLERAKKENLELPDFDFRTIYERGQKLWFVRYSKKLGNKELVEFHVRTVYARMVIGSQPKSICHCVGVNMRNQLFEDKKLATEFYNSLDLTPEEEERKKKSKTADAEDYEEKDGDMDVESVSLEEAMEGDE